MNGRGSNTKKDGAHIRLSHTLLDSPAFAALQPSEIVVLIAMRRQLNGGNNGAIDATATTMRRWGIDSPTTIAKCLRALSALGFIENLRPGRLTHGGRVCGLYRFTDLPCPPSKKRDHLQAGSKATDDWRQWKSLEEAVKAAVEARKTSARTQPADPEQTASKLQKMERSAPRNGVVRSRSWSLPARHAPELGVCQSAGAQPKLLSQNELSDHASGSPDGVGKLHFLEPSIGTRSGAVPVGHGVSSMRATDCRVGQVLRRRTRNSAARLLREGRPVAVREALNARMGASA